MSNNISIVWLGWLGYFAISHLLQLLTLGRAFYTHLPKELTENVNGLSSHASWLSGLFIRPSICFK